MFDDEANNLLPRKKSTVEPLRKLAEVIYDEGLKRFGLDNVNPPSASNKKRRPSRRQEKKLRKIRSSLGHNCWELNKM